MNNKGIEIREVGEDIKYSIYYGILRDMDVRRSTATERVATRIWG
jgi:hypothetical protein